MNIIAYMTNKQDARMHPQHPQQTQGQPNILMILIDDLGWRDLTCYGSSFYETPVLDQLAADGLMFTDAYASCPVCSPTRASIMTGKYPATVGITNFIKGMETGKLMAVDYYDHLPLEECSIASALQEGGYQTWHVGKWHLGDEKFYPEKHGFDINIAGQHWGMPHKGYFSPYGLTNFADGPEGEYLTDRLTDEAIALLHKRDKNKPFFLNMAHYAVHTPIQAPQELIDKYIQKAKDLGLDKETAIIEGEHFPCLHKIEQRVSRRVIQSDPVYAAMIENLDSNIGRLLQAIKDIGEEEDTLVFFTADNGGLATAEGSPTCNAPLVEGKGWMYEGGTRVCQIAKWPRRIAAGTQTSVPVTSTDFYPTLLAAAGLPLRPQQHCDGANILPVLEGAQRLDRDAIFWHYPHYGNQGGTPGASIRSGDWKLIEFYEDNHLELYNLAQDISEEHNLAELEPQRAKDLYDQLAAWRQQVEAKIPEKNPDWASTPKPASYIDSAYI